MSETVPVITVDGPAASGKGIIAKSLSEWLGWHLLDSGLLYRIAGFVALDKNIDPRDVPKVVNLVETQLEIQVQSLHAMENTDEKNDKTCVFIGTDNSRVAFVRIGKRNVISELRSHRVSDSSSLVAAIPHVRKALIPVQRLFRSPPGLIADGRDMGSVVFPDAIVKFYIDADILIRAKRRYIQMHGEEAPNASALYEVKKELQKRDLRDVKRSHSPLVIPGDAIVIDNSQKGIEETLEIVKSALRSVTSLKSRLPVR